MAAPPAVIAGEFDPVTTPLGDGVTLVEASAGTGKTFSITVMVARLVLEGRASELGRILVVTFTNAATDELITRIRAALRTAVMVFAGEADDSEQTRVWQRLLAEQERCGRTREESCRRLRRALSQIDRLSVFTIHGFCKRVLEESALESGTPYGAEFVEAGDELLDCAVRDWWRRTFYEDEPLAALAVARGWTPDTFTPHFRRWRRHPRTSIAPPAPAPGAARDRLRSACAAVVDAWDDRRVGDLVDRIVWKKGSPFGADARADLAEAVAQLACGRLDAAALLGRCTPGGVTGLANRASTSKDVLALIATEPFFEACAGLEPAAAALEHALRCGFICDVELGLEAEKRRQQALGFDDLLRRLHDAILTDGDDGALACAIRERYDAALIDEFQDTDPFQFPIFERAFRGRPLFLIGDPKQAIYGFRGADIFAYAEAVRAADRRYTLPRNWRSTAGLVGALNAVFGRTERAFLRPVEEIGFSEARAARPGPCPLQDRRAPLQWWFVPGNGAEVCTKGDARHALQRRTAAEIVALLENCRIDGTDGPRPVRPGDIAVLVRTHHEAAEAQQMLRTAGVPSIVASTGDILATPEMDELERILTAIAAPQDGERVRAALATGLWGWTADRVASLSATDGELQWTDLVIRLARERESWVRYGFMRTMQRWLAEEHVAERLLRLPDGQRRMTNLRHAIELLHAASEEERLSPDGVLAWIARERAEPVTDGSRRELRLETDAQAVQIVTIHKAKGLEYGIVFCHSLWDSRSPDDDAVLVHEDGGVVLDFGSDRRDERYRRAESEQAAEELRLAYVALTRAKWRCYVGWGLIKGASASALGWLLRDEVAAAAGASCEDLLAAARATMEGSGGQWLARMEALAGAHPELMECEVIDPEPELRRWRPPAREVPAAPAARRFAAHGQLVRLGTASFTSLIRGHEYAPADRDISDPAVPDAPDALQPDAPAPIFAFAKGRRTGDLFHAVFEHADFQAPDSPAMLALVGDLLTRDPQVSRGLARATAADAIVGMLRRTLRATLPGAGFSLSDVPRGATLREWPFVLPLGPITGRTLARAFDAHAAAPELREYARRLEHLSRSEVRGFLTGVVDLAFTHEDRWYLADWKSNHLGDAPGHYHEAAILRAMTGHHYVLQYHLYVLALHRYLTVRLPGYDYDRHMGGVWYAFVRGIDGTSGLGWWHDRPARALIEALDAELVRGGMHAEAAS